jgi:hypothetical protein
MLSDGARVVARAALGGVLLPPAIGAFYVAILSLFTDPAEAHNYLSLGFLGVAFYLGLFLASPFGLAGALVASALAIRWRRQGADCKVIGWRLTVVGAVLGAGSAWFVFTRWLYSAPGISDDLSWVGGGL